MEDIRTYRFEEDEQWHIPDDERIEFDATSEEELSFDIPRD